MVSLHQPADRLRLALDVGRSAAVLARDMRARGVEAIRTKSTATDVVTERGQEGIAKVRELTGGHGAAKVLEAVGHMPAYTQAVGVLRPGGTISRVGVPQYETAPVGFGSLFGLNATLTGGPAPVRAYIERLLPAILDGSVNPGLVFDRTIGLDDVPAGYRAMDEREALKVMITTEGTK